MTISRVEPAERKGIRLKKNKDIAPTNDELILYRTEDGQTRIEFRLKDETVWLSQKLIAELFQKHVRTINKSMLPIFMKNVN